MSGCSRTREVVSWSRAGPAARLEEDLAEHVSDCASCREAVDSVRGSRELLSRAPTREIARERLDAMRFALMTAARESRRVPGREEPRRRMRGRVWLALAAAIMVSIVVMLRLWPAPAANMVDIGASKIAIDLERGAEGFRAGDGADDVFVLVRGGARFSVAPLATGRRFRVVAGLDSLEVRGTRFEVQVEAGRFSRVSVDEGHVVVSLDGGAVVHLRAGEAWQREKVAASASSDSRTQVSVAVPAEVAPGRAAASHGTPLSTVATTAPRVDYDAEFQRGWRSLQEGRAREAAMVFDALALAPNLDPARRGDVLFWSARAHAAAGDAKEAEERADSVASTAPASWYASDAALMAGRACLERGDEACARARLEAAAASPKPAVRDEAKRLLQQLRGASDGGALR